MKLPRLTTIRKGRKKKERRRRRQRKHSHLIFPHFSTLNFFPFPSKKEHSITPGIFSIHPPPPRSLLFQIQLSTIDKGTRFRERSIRRGYAIFSARSPSSTRNRLRSNVTTLSHFSLSPPHLFLPFRLSRLPLAAIFTPRP